VAESNQPAGAQTLADQVKGLADEVKQDAARRAMANAEHAERAETIDAWLSRKRAVAAALVVALPVLAILVVTTIQGESLGELLTPNPPPAASLRQAQAALDKRIEAFRSDYADLPGSLAEVGVPAHADVTYAKSGKQYRVVLKMYGQAVTFDSTQRGHP
jgi:predicted component of type VI protein secretion system